MVGSIAALPRVRLPDLILEDGIASENYKTAVSSLWSSLYRYNAAIVQVSPSDEILLNYAMESSKLFFQSKRPIEPSAAQNLSSMEEAPDWNRDPGYYVEPHLQREVLEFRPGRQSVDDADEVLPACLPNLFSRLGFAARNLLEAISRSLDLRSFSFTDLLDNIPLKSNEQASSVLTVLCHSRRSSNIVDEVKTEDDPLPVQDDLNLGIEKGILSIVKPNKPGLYVKDPQNRWLLLDHDLQPDEVVVITGLTLYQASGGFVAPAVYKIDLLSAALATSAAAVPGALPSPPAVSAMGRVSLMFRLVAKPSSTIHCSAMAAAGHQISAVFQAPVAVSGFMHRALPMDQILSTPPKAMPMGDRIRKRKSNMATERVSIQTAKRLRSEVMRVFKEKVQNLADFKSIAINFCSLKECEEHHMQMEEPPCSYQRSQLAWPQEVPFVSPADLPNRWKQMFLESFDPGWTERQGPDFLSPEPGNTPKRMHQDLMAMIPYKSVMEVQDRFSLKSIYDFLRSNSRPVPTGKPQVVGHRVDIPLLCRLVTEAGGRESFDLNNGFQRFIADTFNLDNASDKEKERAVERLKKLYEQILQDYVNHMLSANRGSSAIPQEEEEEEACEIEDHGHTLQIEGQPLGIRGEEQRHEDDGGGGVDSLMNDPNMDQVDIVAHLSSVSSVDKQWGSGGSAPGI